MEQEYRVFLWFSLSVVSIFTFLLLPIEFYDAAFTSLLFLAAVLTGFCVAKVINEILGEFKGITLVVIAMVLLQLANAGSYRFRRTNLLDDSSIITDGLIVDRSQYYRKSKGYYTLSYSYQTPGGILYGEQDVSFEIYMNTEIGPNVLIDYVPHRTSISRINIQNLIPNENAHKEFMEWQKNNHSK